MYHRAAFAHPVIRQASLVDAWQHERRQAPSFARRQLARLVQGALRPAPDAGQGPLGGTGGGGACWMPTESPCVRTSRAVSYMLRWTAVLHKLARYSMMPFGQTMSPDGAQHGSLLQLRRYVAIEPSVCSRRALFKGRWYSPWTGSSGVDWASAA